MTISFMICNMILPYLLILQLFIYTCNFRSMSLNSNQMCLVSNEFKLKYQIGLKKFIVANALLYCLHLKYFNYFGGTQVK